MNLLADTLFLALLVSLITTAISLGSGVWHFSRFQRLIGELKWLILFVAAVPPYVQAGIWLDLLHLLDLPVQGLFPCVLVQTITLLPLSILILLHGFDQIDANNIEAGQLQGNERRMINRILWPAIRPYAQANLAIVMVFSLLDYTIPTIFQYPVFGLDILETYAATGTGKEAFLRGLPLLMITLPIFTFAGWWLIRQVPRHDRTRSSKTVHISWPILIFTYRMFALALVSMMILAPVLTLVITDAMISNLIETIKQNDRIILYSLGIATLSAIFIVIISFFMVRNLRNRLLIISLVLFVFFCLPPALLGTGMQVVFNQKFLSFLYGHAGILVLVNVARFTAIGFILMYIGKLKLPEAWFEIAKQQSTTRWRQMLHIELPLLLPVMVTVFLLVFMISLGEVGASIAVMPPGGETIATKLFNYLHYGAGEKVNALSLLIFLMMVMTYLLHLLGKYLLKNQKHDSGRSAQ